MTNNDKALSELRTFIRDCNKCGCFTEKEQAQHEKYVSERLEALTPQSSADMGKVRYALERSLHFKSNEGQQALVEEALAILDQQAAPETVSREEFEAVCADLDSAYKTLNEYANQPDVLAALRAKVETMKNNYHDVDYKVGYNAACDQFLRILDEVIGRAE